MILKKSPPSLYTRCGAYGGENRNYFIIKKILHKKYARFLHAKSRAKVKDVNNALIFLIDSYYFTFLKYCVCLYFKIKIAILCLMCLTRGKTYVMRFVTLNEILCQF